MKTYEDILYEVEKPSRYIGQEINSVNKEITEDLTRFGFCFPDVYEVGMSHLGMHILYGCLNARDDIYCERVFSPWMDMETLMRDNEIPIMTVETRTPISELDILGFTLQYELSYTNIINVLDLGRVPFKAAERGENDPIVIAGGPCAYNPEPLADIMDIFVLGEGEEVLIELIDLYKQCKKSWNRREFLERATEIEGIYVPSLYEVSYDDDGKISRFSPIDEKFPKKIKKRIMMDMNESFYPEKFIVPFAEVVHDRAMVEIFRGCTRGCRFCQAGMIYRPIREKNVETITKSAAAILKKTGFEELSVTSLSTCDFPQIKELVKVLIDEHKDDRIGVSLPSLRLDGFPSETVQEIQKIRKTGLTFAPEAGTQRLRDVINKGVNEEDLEKTMGEIFQLGWSRVKLYFMIGLPTEEYEDLDGIVEIGNKVTYIHKQIKDLPNKQPVSVTISAACFVPKPFTPFQWEPQDTIEVFEEKQRYLKTKITNKKIRFNYHGSKTSYLEGVFARGDRRLSDVLIKAWELGCKFDGWDEYFNFELWEKAFDDCGVDPVFYNQRIREVEEILPWDHIDIGVTKSYLLSERNKAKNAELTHDCRLGCTGCGITSAFGGGVCNVSTED